MQPVLAKVTSVLRSSTLKVFQVLGRSNFVKMSLKTKKTGSKKTSVKFTLDCSKAVDDNILDAGHMVSVVLTIIMRLLFLKLR